MNFKYRLISFIAALLAYLLFAFQWASTFIKAWYGNIPEETQYLLKYHNVNPYDLYGWLWGVSFLLFLIAGIITLLINTAFRNLYYIMMVVLFFSSYYTFHFAADFPKWTKTGPLNFVVLCLFGISLFRYYILSGKKSHPEQNNNRT